MKKKLQQIFSIKNENNHKVCTILGFKLKFKKNTTDFEKFEQKYYNLTTNIEERCKCPFCNSESKIPIREFAINNISNDYINTFNVNPFDENLKQAYLIKYQCSNCGIDYYNYYIEDTAEFYEKLLETGNYIYPKYKWEYEHVTDFIKKQNCKRILDIGCGEGFFLDKIKDITEFSMGTEFNKTALEKASEKKLNVVNLPLDKINDRFDLICMFQILEHIKNPNEFINQALSLLHKNGYLCIATPNPDGLWCSSYPWALNLPPHHNLDITKDFYYNISKFYNVEVVTYEQDKPQWNLYKDFYYPYVTKKSLSKNSEDIIYNSFISERDNLIGHNHLCILKKV